MSDKYFLDTNILVYSFNKENPIKQNKSIELVDRALKNQVGCISFQVIQEFLNVARRKFKVPLSSQDCNELLDTVLTPLCEVHSSSPLYTNALEIVERWKYSFYDSIIISAALQSSCDILYSEDLQHDQKIENLRIINPFI